MPVRATINGYGRIGRNILRALDESNCRDEIQIVAVNDLGDAETNAHLTQYGTAHGPFPHEVSVSIVPCTIFRPFWTRLQKASDR